MPLYHLVNFDRRLHHLIYRELRVMVTADRPADCWHRRPIMQILQGVREMRIGFQTGQWEAHPEQQGHAPVFVFHSADHVRLSEVLQSPRTNTRLA